MPSRCVSARWNLCTAHLCSQLPNPSLAPTPTPSLTPQAEVSSRCVAAEPHHGERWCRVAKDVKNAHLAVEVLLRRCVQDLDTQGPP